MHDKLYQIWKDMILIGHIDAIEITYNSDRTEIESIKPVNIRKDDKKY